MRRALLSLAAIGLVLSGCLGAPQAPRAPAEEPAPEAPTLTSVDSPTAPAPAPEAPAAPPAPAWETLNFEGQLTVAAGDPLVGYFAPTGAVDEHGFTVTIAPGATAVIVELLWYDPLYDLDLQVVPPGCDTTLQACLLADRGAPGNGDTPARVEAQDEAYLGPGGEWTFNAWAKGAVNARFHIYATVFWFAEPPEGFSAIPA